MKHLEMVAIAKVLRNSEEITQSQKDALARELSKILLQYDQFFNYKRFEKIVSIEDAE